MKILSYNVNGIRSAFNKGFVKWLKEIDVDVICIQETKANKDQVETSALEEIGFYNYWFSAQKKGYSGVAIFSKTKPKQIFYGTNIDHIDFEGRVIQANFQNFSVISLYLPSGTNIQRLDYKFTFMKDFQDYINNLKNKYSNLVICGDYNICHQPIDIHDPIRNKNVSGFLLEERQWLDQFISCGFIDSFRFLNPEPNSYSWWSYRANSRVNNKGWRIDYAMVSESLKKNIKNSFIMNTAMHSDHCPVGVELIF